MLKAIYFMISLYHGGLNEAKAQALPAPVHFPVFKERPSRSEGGQSSLLVKNIANFMQSSL